MDKEQIQKGIEEKIDKMWNKLTGNTDKDGMIHIDSIFNDLIPEILSELNRLLYPDKVPNSWMKCENNQFINHKGFCSENCPIIKTKTK